MIDRWAEYEFKNGQTAKNRLVVPPMASQTADEEGYVTAQTLEHYQRLTESDAGLIFVEYSFIHKSGRGETKQLAVSTDAHTEGLKEVSRIIKSSGALSGLQIVHVGSKTEKTLTGGELLAPSPSPVPVRNKSMEQPKEMNEKEIQQMIESYFLAASRAYEAGFDTVELHAAHGYGLNQWLSPITNHRLDKYGGSQVKRSEVLYSIVKKIKAEFPQKLLAVRLPVEDHYEGGLVFSDMLITAKTLELIGVDLFDVSSGIGGWKRLRGQKEEGYLVADARKLKSKVETPVVGVGGIVSGEYIDLGLVEESFDFAAVGRSILKSPSDWKARQMLRAPEDKT